MESRKKAEEMKPRVETKPAAKPSMSEEKKYHIDPNLAQWLSKLGLAGTATIDEMIAMNMQMQEFIGKNKM